MKLTFKPTSDQLEYFTKHEIMYIDLDWRIGQYGIPYLTDYPNNSAFLIDFAIEGTDRICRIKSFSDFKGGVVLHSIN